MSLNNETLTDVSLDESLSLDVDDVDGQLTLVSSDGESFALPKKAALMSGLVKTLHEGDVEGNDFMIKNVDKYFLQLVVEYLKHHNGQEPAEIKKPLRSTKMEKIVDDQWDADFIDKLTKKEVFGIILSANYMDIKSLLHLGCAYVATLIKGKSPDEIRKELGDVTNNNDMEDDAEVSAEHSPEDDEKTEAE